MPKARTNCWTCKQRKIGCDRKLPGCLNCQKGQRACQGYALRLAWPDKQDGRRKQKKYKVEDQQIVAKYLKQENGCLAFLNTVVEDMNGSKLVVQDLVKYELMSAMLTTLSKPIQLVQICEQDGMLLNHYDMQVARMTTTIDDETNGFRLALIPMALSSSDLSARSILHTTLAIACYHLGRPQEAMKHKFRAIKDLSDSFATVSMQDVDAATKTYHFAASMMLCVYGVFDESDTAWHMHLEGAKSIFDIIPVEVKSGPGFDFLKPWFQYHYTFSQYTYPPQTTKEHVQLSESTAESNRIIGVLGCSIEVLTMIECINQIRGHRSSADSGCNSSRAPSPTVGHCGILAQLEDRLLNLQQELVVRPGSTSGTIDDARITFTAELYRIAAILYLYQIVPATFLPAVEPQDLLRHGLSILWYMKICSSPWPLFILACSVSDDVDRIRIMDLMEKSGSSRRIGNYSIIIALAKAVWKRQDLIVDEKAKREVDWRDLVEEGGYMPSFI